MKKKYGIVPIKDEIDKIFDDMVKSMDNFRKNFLRMFREPLLEEETEILEPSMDIIDKGDSYLIEVDVPGFDKNNIEINVSKDEIEIKGEKKEEEKEEKKNYIRRERTYASFYRKVGLAEEILPDESSAKVENGVLKITLKKKIPKVIEKKEVRRIPIE